MIHDDDDQWLADEIAHEFTSILRTWLMPAELAKIDYLNEREENKSICHTHDFCDPNQAMIQAFENVELDLDTQNERHIQLCNAAWETAKARGFYQEFR